MIRVFVSILVAGTCLLGPSFVDCEGGCAADSGNTIAAPGGGPPPAPLAVIFPTITPGSCVECANEDCEKCHASSCQFDGEFKVFHNGGGGVPPIYVRENGDKGHTVLRPYNSGVGAKFTSEWVGCGEGWEVTDLIYDGTAYSGSIRAACTACPP